jgi:hypothetical protein
MTGVRFQTTADILLFATTFYEDVEPTKLSISNFPENLPRE